MATLNLKSKFEILVSNMQHPHVFAARLSANLTTDFFHLKSFDYIYLLSMAEYTISPYESRVEPLHNHLETLTQPQELRFTLSIPLPIQKPLLSRSNLPDPVYCHSDVIRHVYERYDQKWLVWFHLSRDLLPKYLRWNENHARLTITKRFNGVGP